MSKIYRKLTRKEVLQIQELWRQKFKESSSPQINSPEFWFEVVVDFLLTRGDDIVSKELVDSEMRVIEYGKAAEYVSALMSVVDVDGLDEHSKVILLITASPEDRDKALRKINL